MVHSLKYLWLFRICPLNIPCTWNCFCFETLWYITINFFFLFFLTQRYNGKLALFLSDFRKAIVNDKILLKEMSQKVSQLASIVNIKRKIQVHCSFNKISRTREIVTSRCTKAVDFYCFLVLLKNLFDTQKWH